jgi:hypothetical protein
MVTKVNPVTDYSVGRSFNGKTVLFAEVDFIADASAENGPGEAIEGVLKQITEVATVIGYSPLVDSDTRMVVMIEGDFPTDTYDGTNSETLYAYLQTTVRALGATFGPNDFDLSAATVAAPTIAAAFTTWYADDVVDHVVV